MPNFSGIWTLTQQMQAKGASTWPATPGAPTIGTATAGIALCASVTFTAPACTGYPSGGITGYRIVSTPGCVSQTGVSSPIVISGLTQSTSYTFKAQATNANGYGALSAASNSVTATIVTCATYTTSGCYSWVAPAGVTSVAVVVVGGGGRGGDTYNTSCCTRGVAGGGGGAGLGYKNAYTVIPANSYTVQVGSAGYDSYFVSGATVKGIGGPSPANSTGGIGGGYVGDGGGNGGNGGNSQGGYGPTGCTTGVGPGGGGAGGYSGTGGRGQYKCGTAATAGAGGGGGGGGRGCTNLGGAGGGGVGLLGSGSNGAAGSTQVAGGGGSGGSTGSTASGRGGGVAGVYGAAGGAASTAGTAYAAGGAGGGGAVRIVWCSGGARGTPSFPSTNVGA